MVNICETHNIQPYVIQISHMYAIERKRARQYLIAIIKILLSLSVFSVGIFLIFYFMYYYKMYVMDKYIFLFAFALSPTTHTLHQVNIVFIYVYTHIPLPAHTHWVQMHARQFFVFQYVEREYVKRNVNALFGC